MIEELEVGILDCHTERGEIAEEIRSLNNRDEDLGDAVSKAKTITGNLRQIIGE
jgi:hypothetical protein